MVYIEAPGQPGLHSETLPQKHKVAAARAKPTSTPSVIPGRLWQSAGFTIVTLFYVCLHCSFCWLQAILHRESLQCAQLFLYRELLRALSGPMATHIHAHVSLCPISVGFFFGFP